MKKNNSRRRSIDRKRYCLSSSLETTWIVRLFLSRCVYIAEKKKDDIDRLPRKKERGEEKRRKKIANRLFVLFVRLLLSPSATDEQINQTFLLCCQEDERTPSSFLPSSSTFTFEWKRKQKKNQQPPPPPSSPLHERKFPPSLFSSSLHIRQQLVVRKEWNGMKKGRLFTWIGCFPPYRKRLWGHQG